ncbi:tripartite tricarboxylate transporter TctB family protein [Paracoccus sediminis]|uniref:Tripartite tricarboxylate transporter TctB family protein n=1 Tax=Paracoccus sediminis TaxID=1214787 RepID=A0A238XSY3_9RHOB|nr:tripartite tricarboxylate transporter TctB family protein [Paracoccus sediminis]TBN47891.1 tripartite tricarboxylate transporter TctB family protein [Paracoccus sediminis]SNR61563.1 Tripartite tricarboxylate transporter TctB family protein [Paracoccus sediminis]
MQGHRTKDFWAGALYLALGLATVILARGLTLGSAARMGPGYFPTVLGGLLAVIGLVSLLRGLVRPAERVDRIHLKPMVLVIGATLFFAASLDVLGLAVALPAAMVIAATASRRFRIAPMPLLGLAGFTLFCVLVFVRGLGVPLPMFGTLFGG